MAVYNETFKLYILDEDENNFAIPTGATEARSVLGNAGNNQITGDAFNNTLDGSTGADILIGGLGNDTYVVDNDDDVVTENAGGGLDTVLSSRTRTLSANVENLVLLGSAALSGTGNALDNLLTGNSGANTLIGAAGNDTLNGGAGDDNLAGGLGDDTYIVNQAGDIVVEDAVAGSGIDTVQASITYTLTANVENLTLTGEAAINGTGNALSNAITGNAAANILLGGEGNDILNGGLGADRLDGGVGNDSYFVDNVGDVVIEGLNGGTDTVTSSINYSLGTGSNIENLQASGSDALTLTGNEQNNTIVGNLGNNRIDGGAGADTMTGGAGDDTFIVDSALDLVFESAAGGKDTVLTSVSYVLLPSSEVETLSFADVKAKTNLSLTGSETANTLIGNAGKNTLIGMGGDDRLEGGLGNDVLRGGAGNDTFAFTTKLGSSNVDRIVDFNPHNADRIALDKKIFTKLGSGKLKDAFYKGVEAHKDSDRIIYNPKNGWLSYDMDGDGDAKAVHFATLSLSKKDAKDLSYSDFLIF